MIMAAGTGGHIIPGLAVAREVQRRGAGEILLTVMDADGMQTGYDIEITRAVAQAVDIPVIASGGAGSPEHLRQVLTDGQADAALAALKNITNLLPISSL